MGNCSFGFNDVNQTTTFAQLSQKVSKVDQLEIDWNAKDKIKMHINQAVQSNNARLFLLVKGITEDIAERLFRDASDEEQEKGYLSLEKPSDVTFVNWWLTSNYNRATFGQETLDELLNPPSCCGLPIDVVESFDQFVENH